MDDKTLEYMKKRVTEADCIKRVIWDLRNNRTMATDRDTTVCPKMSSEYYNAGLPFPAEARAAVVAAIDALIKVQEDKLAEL